MRPAEPHDEPALAEFFAHVTPEDLRFRLLAGIKEVSHERLVAMTSVDHRLTENFLAFIDGEEAVVASAMLAFDEALEKAEIAVSVRSDYKHRVSAGKSCGTWLAMRRDEDSNAGIGRKQRKP